MRFALLVLLASLIVSNVGTAHAQQERPTVRNLQITSERPRRPSGYNAVVVLSLRGQEDHNFGGGVTFVRIHEPRFESIWLPGENRDSFSVRNRRGREDTDARPAQYSAFEVEPGRYAFYLYASELGRTNASMPGRQYCFATIAFDIARGDVLYLGDFVVSGLFDPEIEFDIESARSALSSLTQLQAQLRPATYIENVELVCEWTQMAQFVFTDSERQRLVAGGALPAPAPAETSANTSVLEAEAPPLEN